METESLAKGAKDAAKDAVKHQKTAGADQLGRMAGAVHGAAGALQEEMPTVASYIDDAASRMEHAAGTLRERSLEALLRDARDLGCRQPAVLLAGAVIAGFALVRFLKSSADSQSKA